MNVTVAPSIDLIVECEFATAIPSHRALFQLNAAQAIDNSPAQDLLPAPSLFFARLGREKA